MESMSLKTELLEKLNIIAEKPKNEFDRMISDNRTVIESMNEQDLTEIYMLRRRTDHLCSLIPYKRDEVEMLALSGEVGADSRVAELCDSFNTLDYILIKAKGEKF